MEVFKLQFRDGRLLAVFVFNPEYDITDVSPESVRRQGEPRYRVRGYPGSDVGFPDVVVAVDKSLAVGEFSYPVSERLLAVADIKFVKRVMGVPGDEDGGGITSFVVFSSLGFYPVTPGSASYNIGSPLFTTAKITLSSGKIFEIEAINASEDNKYIQSATLNGKDWNKPWFSHDDIKNGAKLVLKMGDKPNKTWGSADDAVPPSID